MIAVDTNVLIYAVDPKEPAKSQVAGKLLAALSDGEEEFVVPWQAIVEFIGCLYRWEIKGRINRFETEQYIQQLLQVVDVVLPKVKLIETALGLSTAHSLSHWDSLLLAACQEAGVTTLCSEDLTSGATYGTVTVINPFA